ncbi:sialoadhesin-like [Salminus brasiliensis]|uniref:sialoadhesin-like n=1 Tax=Salminus brasiliensis TaxID=930266 RepID=UPI003B82ED27
MAPPLPLVFLLMVVGASGAEWSVNYNQQKICALKGSTVFMNGIFTLPENLTVNKTFWIKCPVKGVKWTDLLKVPDFSGRVEYFTNEQKHFSLKLSNVTKKDEHEFCFRIKTNKKIQKYLGKPGVTLSVTELHVESPGKVTEGQSADLSKTTCSLTDLTFIWFKNGRPLTTKTIRNNQLHLQTVSSEDAGRYSCAVGGSEHLPSTAQTLRVRYPPKRVSVSISPSGEIVEDSSVTLTCSSDANPPVQNYTWFKEGESSLVGSGNTYSIINITADHTGLYYCEALNAVGAQNGSVRINVQNPPRNVSVSISPSGGIVEGSSVNLTCSSDANPPVQNYTWFKEGGSSPVGSGHSYSPLQSGSYYCQAQNQHGAQRSAAVLVILKAGLWVILYVTVGVVGVCGVAAFLTVVFCTRRKKQDRNTNEEIYANVGDCVHPPDDSSIPDYKNAKNVGDSTGPPDDDSSSTPDYENVENIRGAHPSDADSSSIPDYENMNNKSAQCCSVAAGVREERGEAVSYSNSDCLMGSSLCNQIFTASYVSGASGSEWSVKYNQQEICALKGSTVFMNGTFTLPEHLTVNKTFWIIDPVKDWKLTDLSKDSDYSGRVEYFTDKQKHFSLKLSNVTKEDEHEFCFRIKTNGDIQKYLGRPGVKLSVTELHVESPREVTEGESADLTCKTTCSLTDPTFIWYKNRRPLTTKTMKNNQLHLQTVSSEDAGSYSCAVRGSEHLPSTAQTLRVRYPPKSVSVSISPSGEIVEGSSVTLTCSSDANPPVQIYTWFKEGGSSPVESGHTYSIINITADHTGLYYCQNNPPKSVSVSISPSGGIVEDSSVNLTCSSDANPPVKIYTWFKGSSSVGKGETYSFPNISSEDSGGYTCQSRNELGERNSTAVFLNVLYPPRNVSVSISPSGEIVEGSLVTLNCSSDANPPVQNYTWFKEGGSSPVGSGHTYSIISITANHPGLYYCEALNAVGAQNGSVRISVQNGSVPVRFVGCRCGKKADPTAEDDTYTALQLTARSSDEVYHTQSTDDTYTALNPQSRSTDDTYTALNPQSRSTDDTYTALNPQSRSTDDTYSSLNLQSRPSFFQSKKIQN